MVGWVQHHPRFTRCTTPPRRLFRRLVLDHQLGARVALPAVLHPAVARLSQQLRALRLPLRSPSRSHTVARRRRRGGPCPTPAAVAAVAAPPQRFPSTQRRFAALATALPPSPASNSVCRATRRCDPPPPNPTPRDRAPPSPPAAAAGKGRQSRRPGSIRRRMADGPLRRLQACRAGLSRGLAT